MSIFLTRLFFGFACMCAPLNHSSFANVRGLIAKFRLVLFDTGFLIHEENSYINDPVYMHTTFYDAPKQLENV